MKPIEYINEAIKFAKDLGNSESNFAHFYTGFISEVSGELISQLKASFAYGKELDEVNIKEELGDMIWFATNLYLLSLDGKMKHTKAQKEQLSDIITKAIKTAENDDDIAKFRELSTQDKSMQTLGLVLALGRCRNTEEVVTNVISIAFALTLFFYDDIGEIFQMNIDKLTERNKGKKFNAKATINRDTKKERVVLEKTSK